MDLNKLNKSDLFYCYSINLFHFLKANGFFYLAKGLNENTNRYYWVFLRTPEFGQALAEWDVYKKTL